MSKWIAEFDLEDGDTMPEHMDLEYKGAKIDFNCRPMWIPCSERCPERYDNYLITTKDGMVVFGVYDPREKQWCRYDSIKSWWLYGIKVLAWQPLPTPYREGEQDNGTD